MAVTGVNDYTSTYATTNSSSTKGSSGLGSTAQDYLNGLKQKYSDINITVKDFGSDAQLKSYMLGTSGYNNIAISSSVIEKMASDPATAAKYEKVIADVPKSGEEAKKYCAEMGTELIAHSVIVDKNGKVSYCGVGKGMSGENPSAENREKIQKLLEEKRAKKKEEEKLKEKKLAEEKEEEKIKEKRMAKAESLEKLAEMLRANRQAETDVVNIPEAGKGTQFDLSI